IAPLIFNGYWEFFVGLAMTIAILMSLRGQGNVTMSVTEGSLLSQERDSSVAEERSLRVTQQTRFIFFVFGLVTIMLVLVSSFFSGELFAKRNFYGVIRVRADMVGDPPRPAYLMAHGITVHGLQFIEKGRGLPTTYYVRDGGAGLAILNHPTYGKDQRVGMLGVG
ncbi:MAG TPA: hypothetical protein DCX53_12580, partial [Anaerolineae bacterium]|nr:hypothetical protein [Anaerolineae bacterium]